MYAFTQKSVLKGATLKGVSPSAQVSETHKPVYYV